jgi:hypothetical protein
MHLQKAGRDGVQPRARTAAEGQRGGGAAGARASWQARCAAAAHLSQPASAGVLGPAGCAPGAAAAASAPAMLAHRGSRASACGERACTVGAPACEVRWRCGTGAAAATSRARGWPRTCVAAGRVLPGCGGLPGRSDLRQTCHRSRRGRRSLRAGGRGGWSGCGARCVKTAQAPVISGLARLRRGKAPRQLPADGPRCRRQRACIRAPGLPHTFTDARGSLPGWRQRLGGGAAARRPLAAGQLHARLPDAPRPSRPRAAAGGRRAASKARPQQGDAPPHHVRSVKTVAGWRWWSKQTPRECWGHVQTSCSTARARSSSHLCGGWTLIAELAGCRDRRGRRGRYWVGARKRLASFGPPRL